MRSLSKSLAFTFTDQQHAVILLKGELGVGKTAFAKNLINILIKLDRDLITSPTFTIVNKYAHTRHTINHIDLYRITSEDELDFIGVIDAMKKDISIIEWPNKLGKHTPEEYISLEIDDEDTRGYQRNVKITFVGERMKKLSNKMFESSQ